MGWGHSRLGPDAKNRTVDGRPLKLDEKPVEGIGTHSVSMIEFEIPGGYDTFMSKGVITEGSQGRGSINFLVLADPVKQVRPQRSKVSVSFADLGILGKARVRDLWTHRDLGEFSGSFEQEIPLHGAGLFRISPTP